MKNSKYFPSFRQRASAFLLALLLLPTLAPVPLVAMIPARSAGVFRRVRQESRRAFYPKWRRRSPRRLPPRINSNPGKSEWVGISPNRFRTARDLRSIRIAPCPNSNPGDRCRWIWLKTPRSKESVVRAFSLLRWFPRVPVPVPSKGARRLDFSKAFPPNVLKSGDRKPSSTG